MEENITEKGWFYIDYTDNDAHSEYNETFSCTIPIYGKLGDGLGFQEYLRVCRMFALGFGFAPELVEKYIVEDY